MTVITLARSEFGNYRLIGSDGTDDILLQTDYDFPSVAASFGWQKEKTHSAGATHDATDGCDHDGTDGTVACPACGLPASAFIAEARSFLDEHIGDTVEDPGYLQ